MQLAPGRLPVAATGHMRWLQHRCSPVVSDKVYCTMAALQKVCETKWRGWKAFLGTSRLVVQVTKSCLPAHTWPSRQKVKNSHPQLSSPCNRNLPVLCCCCMCTFPCKRKLNTREDQPPKPNSGSVIEQCSNALFVFFISKPCVPHRKYTADLPRLRAGPLMAGITAATAVVASLDRPLLQWSRCQAASRWDAYTVAAATKLQHHVTLIPLVACTVLRC